MGTPADESAQTVNVAAMRVPLRDAGWAGRIRATLLVLAIFAMPTALAFAEPPEVAEILEPAPGGAPLNPADVHMEAVFDDDEDEHKCSDWEIWTVPPAPEEPVWQALCAEGVEKAHIHLGDGDFVNSHAGRTELKYDTEYELRVRFRDDSGAPEDGDWSDWQERRFRTVEEGPAGNKSEAWTARPGYVVEEFASGFQLPVNIAMVPDPGPHLGDPLFYVTELYGGIKVVTRDGVVRDYATDLLNYNPNGVFPGTGEQGLAGLVVEPESGDLFASLVYADEEAAGNPHYTKVIRLHSDERRWEAVGEPETVLDMKELVGASHQVSHLEITPDGNMLVHNADGGFHNPPRDLESFRGKILRMTLEGEPVATNPFFTEDGEDTPRDYVYSLGHRNPFGGAWRRSDSSYFVVENGPKTDRLVRINAGQDYGWEGNDANMTIGASYNWFPAHAPVNIDFVEPDAFGGSGFPPVVQDHAFVTESGPTYASGPQVRGKRIVEFALGGSGELLGGPLMLAEYTGTGRATAVGLAPGPDGLYFTDLYKDHGTSPIDRGAKVLLVRYCGSSCPASPQPLAVAGAADLAPRIERFGVRRKVFRVRGGGGARSSAAKFGTAFRYSLSERASVRIRIRPIVRGWRSRGACRLLSRKVRDRLKARGRLRRCLLPAARGYKAGGGCRPLRSRRVRRGRLCARRGPRGTIAAPGRAGWNRRPYAGRLRKKPLRPGPYLAIARARDRSGKSSRPRAAAFRVVRGAQ
jgi:glucose/arabinose dehydrogenase